MYKPIKYTTLLIFILVSQHLSAQYVYNKIVWSDEFNNNGILDTSKWSFDIGTGCPQLCGWGNNESQFYTSQKAKNTRIENGKLMIVANKELSEGSKYTSARIVTKNKADWKYGRFEIRAKSPQGKGIWPAIWMLPTKWEYGIWPHSGEIDIMENVGYLPDSLYGTVHTEAYNGMKGTQKSGAVFSKNLAADFHVYAMEWTSESISFFLDGKKYHSFANEHTGPDAWPFDKEFHLIMNIAVGGNWGGKYGIDDNIFPQKMEVDYVRVYQ